MTCNACEVSFQGTQSLVVNVVKSGTSAVVSATSQGKNIVMIRRVILCASYPGGGQSLWFLRPPPDPITWMYPSAYFEPVIGATLYVLNGLPAGTVVQAQAEYIEIDGRSRSCPQIM
jgi:hypothetical protein